MTPCHTCANARRVLTRAECGLPTGAEVALDAVLGWLERLGLCIEDGQEVPLGFERCPGWIQQQTEVKHG